MTRFRPCIDIHSGQVKQIVGSTLSLSTDPSSSSSSASLLQTNFVSPLPSSHFAKLYKDNNLTGAHVVLLGPGCEQAAQDALREWPGSLQVGGGISDRNAAEWIEQGADKVILTSFLFPNGSFSQERLSSVLSSLEPYGGKNRLVIDLSCRKKGDASKWYVAMNKWQTTTDTEVNQETIRLLEPQCSEFLIHAADVEGLCRGIDEDLVWALGQWCSIPTTYAGGAYNIEDLSKVRDLSAGKVDLTFGSALDIFGGDKVKFEDCVRWNRENTN